MVQEEWPADFVIATGKVTSVRQLITTAFSCIGLNYWEYIEVDARLPQLAEQELLIGDASKARRQLGWTCQVEFKEMVVEMVKTSIQELTGSASADNPPLTLSTIREVQESVMRKTA